MSEDLSDRKTEHLMLAQKAQVSSDYLDQKFDYEPLLAPTPSSDQRLLKRDFLGKSMDAPLWISSMTGGTGPARHINQFLARACSHFKLGMGLGSCRPLLEDDTYFEDFNLRPILGQDRPFWANLGIAQVEQLLEAGEAHKIVEICQRLDTDGLIIHINPLQEFFQREGDVLKHAPINTIEKFLEWQAKKNVSVPVIVKEVGHGMGPRSLRSLLKLPIAAIEFAAFGGTNFSKLEVLRGSPFESCGALSLVGHNAEEMLILTNSLLDELGEKTRCRNFIISGGVSSFLEGYWLTKRSNGNAVYGQAKLFLEHAAKGEDALFAFTKAQILGLNMASAFLKAKVERKLDGGS